jgi:hypothetical protein
MLKYTTVLVAAHGAPANTRAVRALAGEAYIGKASPGLLCCLFYEEERAMGSSLAAMRRTIARRPPCPESAWEPSELERKSLTNKAALWRQADFLGAMMMP